jgi:hypothetical protein
VGIASKRTRREVRKRKKNADAGACIEWNDSTKSAEISK